MATAQSAPAKRRVRLTRARKEEISSGDVKVLLDDLTTKMRDAQAKINASARELAALEKQAFEAMQAAKLAKHSSAAGDLEVKVPSGRSSTYIDPRQYYKAVDSPDDFFDSVKVTMKDAKKNLSGKEFDAIAEVTPGKPGSPVLKTEYYYPEGAVKDG